MGGVYGDKLTTVPPLIETRPFTIQPELYAWPSFRIFSEQVIWLYLLLLVAIAFLLRMGMQMSVGIAIVAAICVVGAGLGMSFMKYKAFLRKPENKQIYRNCVVSLTDDEVRQDFTDESFMAIKLFAIKAFRDLGGFYFVFATPQQGIVVPKTAFESRDDSFQFAQCVRQAARGK
jgi:hypothetical protein